MDDRHEKIKKVNDFVDRGEECIVMGDLNSEVKMPRKEKCSKKGVQATTLDLSIVTLNLKAYVKKFTVDSKREWTPANAVRMQGV